MIEHGRETSDRAGFQTWFCAAVGKSCDCSVPQCPHMESLCDDEAWLTKGKSHGEAAFGTNTHLLVGTIQSRAFILQKGTEAPRGEGRLTSLRKLVSLVHVVGPPWGLPWRSWGTSCLSSSLKKKKNPSRFTTLCAGFGVSSTKIRVSAFLPLAVLCLKVMTSTSLGFPIGKMGS